MSGANESGDPRPSLPAGREDAPEALIRLDDPAGGAVAWVCPELGANVVAFAVKTTDGWRQVLHQTGPDTLRERPSRFGYPILFPFPGHMLRGQYRWQGVEHAMPMLNPDAPSYTHGFAHQRPWRVTNQTANTLVAVIDTRTDLEPAQRAGYPFDATLILEISVSGGALTVALVAENVGAEAAPVGIGLHPYFDPEGYFGVDRTALDVTMPGTHARQLTSGPPVPTGVIESVAPGEPVTPVPFGTTMLVSRTGFGETPTARITVSGAATNAGAIDLVMDEGWEDVLLFAPPDGPSISLEPHTCAPGASSLADDSPDGLRGLAPGAQLRVRATIKIVAAAAS